MYDAKLPIPQELLREAEPFMQRIEVAAGEYFCRAGDASGRIGLIERGFLRIYHVTENGDERTKIFRGAGELIAPYADILAHQPSGSFVQAIRDSVLRVARFDDFEKLAQKHLRWALFLKRVAEHNYLEKERREHELLSLSAEQRYLLLVEQEDWVENAPLRMIATYLGITPIALSRIRRRLGAR